ncbi:MAG TPA: AsmA family protein [Steroidobacteraceae bacterium]|nr:AsmA family protein [Steroidobacteraceae bacterium]
MKRSLVVRRVAGWTAASLAVAIVMLAGLSVSLDAGYLRVPFIRFLSSHAGRPIQIDGLLETHIWSLHPRVIAERVTIGNPPWTAPGITARVEKVAVVLHLSQGGDSSLGIQRLEMDGAKLTLIRDSKGHANWQTSDPDMGGESSVPLIRSLSMRGVLELEDRLRHLRFKGTVSAEDVIGAGNLPPLRIAGQGELNGRTAAFEVIGDPLAAASHERTYGFKFSERSSGSVLAGDGALLRAFDFSGIDAKFSASGKDLLDLYFLTGVTLVNTGSYQLSGEVSRRGTHTEFRNLAVKSGDSDVLAKVSIESSSGRPKFEADLTSQVIRMSDLGARAAGREHDPESGRLLLSNAMLSPRAVRHGDWRVHFHARRVDVGHVPLQDVSAKMTIDRGILIIDPSSAGVLGGKLNARLRLDAKTDDPAAEVDLRFTDLQLAQFGRKDAGPPPFEGSLQARATVTGRGRSIHEVAASASGPVTAVLVHGAIRASLAELTGIDLRALGLMLTKNKQATGIRCLIASFQAHDGTLEAQRLVIDTDPVLITGEGQLHLDTETPDFTLRGHPKGLRLFRLRAPVSVRGTLLHPEVSLQARNAVAQTAEAVALGAALTPLAAVLAFVDPGLAKDADCASLQEAAAASAP